MVVCCGIEGRGLVFFFLFFFLLFCPRESPRLSSHRDGARVIPLEVMDTVIKCLLLHQQKALLLHQQKAMFRLVPVPENQTRAPSLNGALAETSSEEVAQCNMKGLNLFRKYETGLEMLLPGYRKRVDTSFMALAGF